LIYRYFVPVVDQHEFDFLLKYGYHSSALLIMARVEQFTPPSVEVNEHYPCFIVNLEEGGFDHLLFDQNVELLDPRVPILLQEVADSKWEAK